MEYKMSKPTQEDRYLFCKIHYAETTIVPEGIQYPLEINFELIEAQIIQIKDELNIINKKINSYYWDFSLEICKEVGSRKMGIPMVILMRPGPRYYGSKGLLVDFLQEVLVPETVSRLISQNKARLKSVPQRTI
ncbi:hypothetical protein C1645_824850 [Glomus cerebriforme]|uniref:Uncharacterized protein n=1 Tax=Glomus cerebriforme TaxID=658196 RepID=A0A397SUS5_9GLOM|nr:hypothetical protein C1645_824850 [Glomus cerebriforme]